MTEIKFNLEELLALDKPDAGEEKMSPERFIDWIRGGLGGEVFEALADVIQAQLPNPEPKGDVLIYAGGKLWVRVHNGWMRTDDISVIAQWDEIYTAPDYIVYERRT